MSDTQAHLATWEAAGLIDAATAERIRTWQVTAPDATEAPRPSPETSRRPSAVGAIFGPGITIGELFSYLGADLPARGDGCLHRPDRRYATRSRNDIRRWCGNSGSGPVRDRLSPARLSTSAAIAPRVWRSSSPRPTLAWRAVSRPRWPG